MFGNQAIMCNWNYLKGDGWTAIPNLYKLSMASGFAIYSINQISDLIYQMSYIIYKIPDILFQLYE